MIGPGHKKQNNINCSYCRWAATRILESYECPLTIKEYMAKRAAIKAKGLLTKYDNPFVTTLSSVQESMCYNM